MGFFNLAAVTLLATCCASAVLAQGEASLPAATPVTPPAGLVRTHTASLPGDNLALHRPYTLSRKPNYALCSDPGDATQLTDGAFAQGFFWTDRATVGWQNTPRIDMVVDLGSIQPIGAIAINIGGSRKSAALTGVDLPDAWFLVSDDGQAFRRVASFQGYRTPDLPDSYVRRYTAFELEVAARFVAIVLAPNGAYAFLDEIEVLRGTNVLPATTATLTLAELEPEMSSQRGVQLAEMGRERARAARIATVRANLLAAGGTATAALASLAGADDEAHWLQANARLAAARCPGQMPIVWSRDRWQDAAACTLPPAGAEAPNALSLLMGCDEYESAAVALTNPGDAPLRFTANLGDLVGESGSIPASNVTLRIDAFVDCRDGVPRPDALPRMEAAGAVIEPGCTRLLWIVVRTDGQAAGSYRGELVMAGSFGRRTVPVVVEVVAVRLPVPMPLATLDWGYLTFAPCQADPDAAIRDRVAHRINTAVLDASCLPRFAVAADGTLTNREFTTFNATVARYRAAGMERFIFFTFFGDATGVNSPLGAHVHAPAGLAVDSSIWTNALRNVMATWLRHCAVIGLPPDQVAFYPWDEPHDNQLAEAGAIWRAIRAADPGARCFVTTPNNTIPALRVIADDIAIWCPHLFRSIGKPFTAEQQAFYRERQAAGAQFWLYHCLGPDKSFPPLAHYRRLAWDAWAMGASGVGIWNYADTGGGPFTSAWNDLDGSREDFAMIYDAATAPEGVSRREAQIPSRRWEAFRDGIEDYAYLWALREAAHTARARGEPERAAAAEAVIRETAAAVAASPGADATYRDVHARLLRALDALR